MSSEDYYDSLLTGNYPGRNVEIKREDLEKHIDAGLSSVKIAKKLGVSYTTVLRRVKAKFPDLEEQLKINGKTCQIRRAAQ